MTKGLFKKTWSMVLMLALYGFLPTDHVRPALSQDQKVVANGISIGTKINNANWRQYEQFMTEGLKTLFAGTSYWHMNDAVEIEVGPTKHIPLPAPYVADAAKVGGHTTLAQTADGGFVPYGYTVGLPFPEAPGSDPSIAGQKIYWNNFFRPAPRVEAAPNCSYIIDEYGNATKTGDQIAVASQIAYLSDPPFPREEKENGGYWYAGYLEQTAPEQGKYFAILVLSPKNPTKLDEQYEYVPSLRRSLRISQAARCAPIFGTDFTLEEFNDGPPRQGNMFKIEYLGEKKILALMHAKPKSFGKTCAFPNQPDPQYYYQGDRNRIPFPKPDAGEWEVRDAYVVKMTRLPSLATGYCYGKRVLYLDKENYFPLSTDIWDINDKLYKSILMFESPSHIPTLRSDDQILGITGNSVVFGVNFQDSHVSIFVGMAPCVDGQCDGFLDVSRYASPAGLMRIVK